MKALETIVEYVKEIECGPGISIALLESLEKTWNRCKSKKSALNIFTAIGAICSPKAFGCSVEIFDVMKSFFELHCGHLKRQASRDWVYYFAALDAMRTRSGMDMINVIGTVLRYQKLNGRDLAAIYDLGMLRPDMLEMVQDLMVQKADMEELKLVAVAGRRCYDLMRFLETPPHRWGPPSQTVRNSNFHPHKLAVVCDTDPDSILVEQRTRRQRGPGLGLRLLPAGHARSFRESDNDRNSSDEDVFALDEEHCCMFTAISLI